MISLMTLLYHTMEKHHPNKGLIDYIIRYQILGTNLFLPLMETEILSR